MSSSARADYDRITSTNDPYKILDIPSDASSETVRGAYKRLSLKFHPDRLVMPAIKPGSMQEVMAEEVRQQANKCFQAVADAADVLLDPSKRGELDRKLGSAGRDAALVPYSAPPYAQPPPHHAAPPHRSSTYSEDRHSAFDDPYLPPQQPRRRSSTFDVPSSSSYRPPSDRFPPSRPDPRKMFDDLMGFGGSRGDGRDPFDLFSAMGHGGGRDRGRGDPFAASDPFEAFFGGGDMGRDMLGGSQHDDPLLNAFNNMSMQSKPNESNGQRGAFASHRVTRRHTSRNGDVTMSRSESLAMMDHGERGKVLVESSYRVMGFQPGSGSKGISSGSDGFPSFAEEPYSRPMSSYGVSAPSSMADYGAPPSAFAQPSRQRRLSLSGAPPPSSRSLMGRGYPAMDDSRMLTGAVPPHVSAGKDLALYGDRSPVRSGGGADDWARAGAMVPRPASSALVGPGVRYGSYY